MINAMYLYRDEYSFKHWGVSVHCTEHTVQYIGIYVYYTVLYDTKQYYTVLNSTILYYKVPYSTTQYHTILYSTILYYKVPYSTTQYYTVLYSTVESLKCTIYTTQYIVHST